MSLTIRQFGSKFSSIIAQWLGKSVFAISDQGVMTGANFVSGIMLARWLPPEQYGATAIAYTFFLLLSIANESLILQPMTVFGASTLKDRLGDYSAVLRWQFAAVAVATFGILAVASAFTFIAGKSAFLTLGLAGMAVAAPFVLLMWLTRYMYYVRLDPRESLVGSGCYATTLFILTPLLQFLHWLNAFTAFLAMGLAAMLAALVQLIRLRRRREATVSPLDLRTLSREHWHFGKWLLASSIVVWLPSNIYYAVFAPSGEMQNAGAFRALLNFALPVGQTATALSMLVQPYMARLKEDKGVEAVTSAVFRTTFLYLGVGICYWAVFVLFNRTAYHLLYGGRYLDSAYLLPFLAISSILGALSHAPGAGLRALRSSRSVFFAYLVPSLISIAIGIPLTLRIGLKGSIAGMIIANSAACFLSYVFFFARQRATASRIQNASLETTVA